MCICLFSYVRILNRGLAKAAGPSVAGSQSTADRPPQEPSMARAPSLRQAPLPFTHYSLQGGSDTSASTTIAQIEAAQAQSAQAALDRMKAAAAVAAAAKALKQDAESAPAAQSQGPLTEAVLLLHLQRTAPAPAPACWRPPGQRQIWATRGGTRRTAAGRSESGGTRDSRRACTDRGGSRCTEPTR